MKGLSIKQPWASLIAHGIKDIENRTWKTHFRGRIYIHASGASAGTPIELLDENQIKTLQSGFCEFHYPKSAIIGEVDIIDCVINHPSIWAEKTFMYEADEQTGELPIGKPIYNWVLANAVLYDKPVLNVKGKLSFWDWNGCHICHKETDPDFICRSCEQIVCEDHKIKFNQFTQVDYTLCQNCNHVS